jgi:hypothetical protein
MSVVYLVKDMLLFLIDNILIYKTLEIGFLKTLINALVLCFCCIFMEQ